MTRRLYVGNLSYQATEQQLRDLFSQAGEISKIEIAASKYTGQGQGFAFLEMATDEGTKAAIDKFSGYALDNRALIVYLDRARPGDR